MVCRWYPYGPSKGHSIGDWNRQKDQGNPALLSALPSSSPAGNCTLIGQKNYPSPHGRIKAGCFRGFPQVRSDPLYSLQNVCIPSGCKFQSLTQSLLTDRLQIRRWKSTWPHAGREGPDAWLRARSERPAERRTIGKRQAYQVSECRGSANRLQGLEVMTNDLRSTRVRGRSPQSMASRAAGITLVALVVLGCAGSARAGKLSWLDDVVREVIAETRASSKSLVRGGEGAKVELRTAGRLFTSHDAEEGLEQLIKRSDELARAGRRIDHPTEALLQGRISRLLEHDPPALRSFAALEPAEKRLVVEMGEAARRLAQRYPEQAETMVRQLGPEGLTAVRVFGDDVAEVMIKEGPESMNILRKTGKGGWSFFTHQLLPHKKKLAAAGVLAAFMVDPDRFVNYAGQATQFAAREFARAGVALATAAGTGASQGLESSISQALAAGGIHQPIFRYLAMALASLVAACSLLVVAG